MPAVRYVRMPYFKATGVGRKLPALAIFGPTHISGTTEHRATSQFWQHYGALQPHVRGAADKQFSLLKGNPLHRSLQFKKIGDRHRHGEEIHSVRVTLSNRALRSKDPTVSYGSGSATTKHMKTSSLRARATILFEDGDAWGVDLEDYR